MGSLGTDFDSKFAKLEQKHKAGLTVGLADINGTVARLDIDVLMHRHPDCFNIFILGMRELQKRPASDIMGWFQIAGIHGYPKALWYDVPDKNLDLEDDSGYCQHAKNKFPTWHRPYICMLEQAIFIHMVYVARSYNEPHRSKYLAEVLNFRLPYWDYYRPRGGEVSFPGVYDQGLLTCAPYDYSAPRIFTQEQIWVRRSPDNELTELDYNPFHHFSFSTENGTIREAEWSSAERRNTRSDNPHFKLNHVRTSRHPYQEPGKEFEWDDPVRLNSTLNELRMDTNRYVLAMIGEDYYEDYEDFSTYAEDPVSHAPTIGKPKKDLGDTLDPHKNAKHDSYVNSGSLEALHNLYHGLCGGPDNNTAHMGIVALAAFDPIFWFHHNNIERIFTIWQTVHKGQPKSWFLNSKDANAPLSPFLIDPNDKNKFWTSETVREPHKSLGYTYEDIKPTAQQTRDDFINLYKWSVPDRISANWGPIPDEMAKYMDVVKKTDFFTAPNSQRAPDLLLHQTCEISTELRSRMARLNDPTVTVAEVGETWEWYIDDRIERLAMNGSFSINYYLNYSDDQPIDDSTPASTCPTLAGKTYIFAQAVEDCANCRNQDGEKTVVTNTVPITSQLLDYIELHERGVGTHLQSLAPEHVVPFLVERLRWRVVTATGMKVDTRLLSNEKQFRVGISAVKKNGPSFSGEAPELFKFPNIIPLIISHSTGHPTATDTIRTQEELQ